MPNREFSINVLSLKNEFGSSTDRDVVNRRFGIYVTPCIL